MIMYTCFHSKSSLEHIYKSEKDFFIPQKERETSLVLIRCNFVAIYLYYLQVHCLLLHLFPRDQAQATIILLLKNKCTPEISNDDPRHHPMSFEGTHLTSFSKGSTRAFELDTKEEILMPIQKLLMRLQHKSFRSCPNTTCCSYSQERQYMLHSFIMQQTSDFVHCFYLLLLSQS